MGEDEHRLRRHVRAMGAVNRQLQAQLGGGAAASSVRGPGASDEADLLAGPGAGPSAASTSAPRRASTASTWLEQLAVSTELHKPFLVRPSNGRTFLIEGGYRREVPSGLLAAGLERMLGPRQDVADDELERWTEGVPVGVFEGPVGPPFVIIGGRRRPVRGLPLPYPVSADQMQLFQEGPELNVAAATVSRAQFQQAMYGRYQLERLRSAVARRGIAGALTAVVRRVARRVRRAARETAT